MLKFTYNTYTIGDGNNNSYITQSNRQSGPNQEINMRGRQGYDGNILLNKQNREKYINFSVYVKETSETNLLSKVNTIKTALGLNGLNELTIEDSSGNIYAYDAEIISMENFTVRRRGDITYMEFDINFVVPNGYGTLSSTNDTYTNETGDVFIDNRFPVGTATPQQIVTIDFNGSYDGDITFRVENNTFIDEVSFSITTDGGTSNRVVIDCTSGNIGVYHYDDSNDLIGELDPNGSFPRGLLVGTANDIYIEFSTTHNVNISHYYDHRYL